ncbi:glutamine amidotransferase [Flagellimonas aquimarina]|jgi:transcriptional regulator GlxA family with amidase domain|uniref:Glutamine amidotransferase n=1 Tax=Flagellimonas aquimarina TaxID=2201895 RepID=A0A316KYS2_9FLAO|nr:DJ-1/PfpI family protein [Allomuricauda koreensis]PWL38218.1 glutamine amidotransferase [Allomuricauda koreensis]
MKKSALLLILLMFSISCMNKNQDGDVLNTTQRKFPELAADRYNVAFLIMDGVYNTEFTAPYDIFQHTQYRKGIKAMNTFTVANTLEAVTSFEGVRFLPDFDYTKDSIPNIDILVVPSAEHHLDSDLKDSTMLNFVKKVSKEALFVTSHCDGAFVLAKTGILNEVVSTTFPSDIEKYKAMFPQLKVKDSVLFVHDGKFITSAGGAKSFEAALYLCEFLYGKEIAESIAGGLVIDWDLNSFPRIIPQ